MQPRRRGQTSQGKHSFAVRENTLFANNKSDRKNSFYQSLINRSLELYNSKEADKSEFVFGSNPYNFIILNEGEAPWKRAGSKPPFAFVLNEEKEEQDYSSWGMESTEVRKMSSARNILRRMDLQYGNIFKDQNSNVEEDIAEKQIFFNSSLLYLIAATDGNEDSIGHSKLVASYTTLLTKDLGIEDKDFLVNIQRGALLHDVGKIKEYSSQSSLYSLSNILLILFNLETEGKTCPFIYLESDGTSIPTSFSFSTMSFCFMFLFLHSRLKA